VTAGLDNSAIDAAAKQLQRILDKYRPGPEPSEDEIPSHITAVSTSGKFPVDHAKVQGGTLEEMGITKDIIERKEKLLAYWASGSGADRARSITVGLRQLRPATLQDEPKLTESLKKAIEAYGCKVTQISVRKPADTSFDHRAFITLDGFDKIEDIVTNKIKIGNITLTPYPPTQKVPVHPYQCVIDGGMDGLPHAEDVWEYIESLAECDLAWTQVANASTYYFVISETDFEKTRIVLQNWNPASKYLSIPTPQTFYGFQGRKKAPPPATADQVREIQDLGAQGLKEVHARIEATAERIQKDTTEKVQTMATQFTGSVEKILTMCNERQFSMWQRSTVGMIKIAKSNTSSLSRSL
jgi:hypothetical protein